MLKIAMILMLIAVVILAVCVCLMRKNNYLTFLLKTLEVIALVSLGFIVANFKDDFSGYSILVILSVLPMILAAFDLSQLLGEKKENKEIELATQTETEETLINEVSETPQEEPTLQNKKQNVLAQSNGNLFFAIGTFLSAVCISVATLYVGKETYLGALIGLLIGAGATFALLAIKKLKNPIDIISYALIFCSIGLMFANIILAMLYSLSTSNIMFCLGCLLFGTFTGLKLKFNKNYITAVYYASVIFLLLSILL